MKKIVQVRREKAGAAGFPTAPFPGDVLRD